MKVLMHICCAPCAVFPLSTPFLKAHSVTGFFYNPNIHPFLEYRKRLECLLSFAKFMDLSLIYEQGYPCKDFLQLINGREQERCRLCYRLRLEKTAFVAKTNGFECFSSTLLYSKYQNHQQIREIGEEVAATLGIMFLYEDFRDGWYKGIEESKKRNLYRQRYCGCLYSERERFIKKSGTPKL